MYNRSRQNKTLAFLDTYVSICLTDDGSAKVKVYRKGDTHRPVSELGVKPSITLCGEDPLAKSRKIDIRGGGQDQRGGTHQKSPEYERLQTLDC